MMLGLSRPLRVVCAGVLWAAACTGSDDGDDETGATPTTDSSSTSRGTESSPTGDPSTAGTTMDPCVEGSAACPCGFQMSCDPGLSCVGEMCVPVGADSGTTGGSDSDSGTTGTGAIACGDGQAAPGELCFAARTIPVAMGAGAVGVQAGTVDSDGFFDVVTVNASAGNFALRSGDGMGGFSVVNVRNAGTAPGAIRLGDFNADGNLDVVTLSQGDLALSVFTGMGNGLFGVGSSVPLAEGAVSLAVLDVDADADTDIFVADATNDTVLLYRANGLGFSPAQPFSVGMGPVAIAFGDLSGDGVADMITANEATVSVRLGNGDGDFGTASTTAGPTDPTDIGVGDFNGDGDRDVLVVSPASGQFSVLAGGGIGDLGAPLPSAAGPSPQAVVVADLDLDGDQDAAIVSGGDSMLRLFINDGATLVAGDTYPVGAGPVDVTVSDLNDDGLLDVITANATAGTISVLLSDA